MITTILISFATMAAAAPFQLVERATFTSLNSTGLRIHPPSGRAFTSASGTFAIPAVPSSGAKSPGGATPIVSLDEGIGAGCFYELGTSSQYVSVCSLLWSATSGGGSTGSIVRFAPQAGDSVAVTLNQINDTAAQATFRSSSSGQSFTSVVRKPANGTNLVGQEAGFTTGFMFNRTDFANSPFRNSSWSGASATTGSVVGAPVTVGLNGADVVIQVDSQGRPISQVTTTSASTFYTYFTGGAA